MGSLLRLISSELCIFMELGFVNFESIIDFYSILRVEGTEYAPGPGTFIVYRYTDRILLRLTSSCLDFIDAYLFSSVDGAV